MNQGAWILRLVGLANCVMWHARLDEPNVPDWRGRGIDCAGSRPRHLLAIGNLLLAANEASNNVAIFRLSADGEPNLAATLPSGAPTVFVRL